jgi:UDP-N-acetylmuramoyl-L-alanyl-D-glutamate--2,6-diaminopimelate ligase
MGKAASAQADFTIVTSDNPRHEDPQTIIAQVLAGVSGKHGVEPDRASAINSAIQMAKIGDIVLLAGKGHEDTQQIGDSKLPFSDALVASEALNKRKESRS